MDPTSIDLLNFIFDGLIVIKSVRLVAHFAYRSSLDVTLLSFTLTGIFLSDTCDSFLIAFSHMNGLSLTNTVFCFMVSMESFQFVNLGLLKFLQVKVLEGKVIIRPSLAWKVIFEPRDLKHAFE